MGLRIQQLPPAIANQIAAGEVIERPASVVKELLENSLDAGASHIHIEIDYGGLNQIKISDNGTGIVAQDLPLAIAAHATSKITTFDDLYAIDSMGFRGEALASITSVAKVIISSRPKSQEHAMMLSAQGASYTIKPCARAPGTTIEVRDLFFNAPVRKRFLKNERIEFQAIETVVKRFALSAPHIAITLSHNNKSVLSFPSALNEQAKQSRMAKIFGAAFIKDAIFLDVEQGLMRLSGWISGLGFQRSQNDKQWVYINQRMVKDKLINHALKQAYDGMLHPGRFSACLLYLSINNAEVDINVHPTKHEVRFQQPRLIHDFFTTQLNRALSSVEPILNDPGSSQSLISTICEPHPTSSSAIIQREDYQPIQLKKALSNPMQETLQQKSNWISLNKQYCLLFIAQKPYLVDLINLYSQWLGAQLTKAVFPLVSRPLLVPINYPMTPKLLSHGVLYTEQLSQLGIMIERVNSERFSVRSMPVCSPHLDLHKFLHAIGELDSLTHLQLLELLCQSQILSIEVLSEEERMELQLYIKQSLSTELKQSKIGRVLTIDDCRMLLHV